MSRFFAPSCLSTCSSMGRPWQSHPGTKSESLPLIEACFTTMSFRILLRKCPRWIEPFAYGGPSWKTNFSRPAFLRRICS